MNNRIVTDDNTPYIIEFNSIGSTDLGYITVAEFPKNIPFDTKRVYWTYFTPHNVQRGGHAHKKLEQIIIAVSGVIDFKLESIDGKKYRFKLDNPDKGLYIPRGYWRTIQFSHNAVLVCLASMEYLADDYIRNYDDFKKLNYLI